MGLYRESVTYLCLAGNEGIEASMGSFIWGVGDCRETTVSMRFPELGGFLARGPLLKVVGSCFRLGTLAERSRDTILSSLGGFKPKE